MCFPTLQRQANEPAKGPSASFLDDPHAERKATRTVLDKHKLFTPRPKQLLETAERWAVIGQGPKSSPAP